MSDRTSAAALDVPAVSAWFAAHPKLAESLRVEDLRDGRDAFRFAMEREKVHRQTLPELRQLSKATAEKIAKVLEYLTSFVERPCPQVRVWYFADVQPLMFLRQYIWVLREIQRCWIALYTERHSELLDLKSDIDSLVTFFVEILPKTVLCRVNRQAIIFYQSRVRDSCESRKLDLLQRLAKRMKAAIRRFPRVLWWKSFHEFFAGMIDDPPMDPAVCYFPVIHQEHSLSRYFFKDDPSKCARIDAFLLTVGDVPPEQFVNNLIELICTLIPNCADLAPQKQSAALLIFYRCLFNRCYEIRPSFFRPRKEGLDLLLKVREIGKLPADSPAFCLPWNLLPDVDHNLRIRDLFAGSRFSKAAAILCASMFECSTLDQLFQLNNALTEIRLTAVSYGQMGGLRSEILSFDELFALLFGVLTAADSADVLYLKWMIGNFAPKQWLSPSLEYALAALDALVLHLLQFEP
jgi:hypothetical protein